jgi:hypothetical protein
VTTLIIPLMGLAFSPSIVPCTLSLWSVIRVRVSMISMRSYSSSSLSLSFGSDDDDDEDMDASVTSSPR